MNYMESLTLKKTSTSIAQLALMICLLTFAVSVINQYQSVNHKSLKEQSIGTGNVIAALVVIKTLLGRQFSPRGQKWCVRCV